MEMTFIKSQLVEMPMRAGVMSQRYFFPTQNFLRLKQINSIEVLSANDITVAPSGNAVMSGTLLKVGMLTIYGDNPESPNAQGEWMQQIPLVTLHRLVNGTDPYVFGLFNIVARNIIWEKSYVDFFGTPATLADATSILFQVGYEGNEGDN